MSIQVNTTTLPGKIHVSQIDGLSDTYVTKAEIGESEKVIAAALTDLNNNVTELQENSVFIAEYGVTTWSDIEAALTAGKEVVAKRDNLFYYPIAISSTQVRFSAVQSPATIRMIDCRTTGWAVYGNSPLQVKNLVTSLSASSTDTQYPSAKAVADYAEAKTNKVTSLSSSSTDVEYPSAKAVWDEVGDINGVLDALNGGDSGAFSNLYKMGVVSQTQTWTKASDGGYDYTMSNPVTGYIPQANIDLFESAGATFNTTTGYFELNGLTDISYKEMQVIYNDTPRTAKRLNRLFCWFKGRTNLPFVFTDTDGAIADSVNNQFEDRQFVNGLAFSKLEVFNIPYTTSQNASYTADFSAIASFTYRADYLHELKHPFIITGDISNIAFGNAVSLEEISIMQLKANIPFTNCARLSVASILYMIQNAANTSAITITLHATAYARAIADTDVQAALEAHPTITLASA